MEHVFEGFTSVVLPTNIVVYQDNVLLGTRIEKALNLKVQAVKRVTGKSNDD